MSFEVFCWSRFELSRHCFPMSFCIRFWFNTTTAMTWIIPVASSNRKTSLFDSLLMFMMWLNEQWLMKSAPYDWNIKSILISDNPIQFARFLAPISRLRSSRSFWVLSGSNKFEGIRLRFFPQKAKFAKLKRAREKRRKVHFQLIELYFWLHSLVRPEPRVGWRSSLKFPFLPPLLKKGFIIIIPCLRPRGMEYIRITLPRKHNWLFGWAVTSLI